MLTFISRIPIFRRLFFTFLLAAIIPGIVILILGGTFINTLGQRSRAIQTNVKLLQATQNLNDELNSTNDPLIKLYQATQKTNGPVMQDDIQKAYYDTSHTSAAAFDKSLKEYQQKYLIKTSANMSDINNILLIDDPNTSIINDQQDTFTLIAGTLWPAYQHDYTSALASITNRDPAAPDLLQAVQIKYKPLSTALKHINELASRTNDAVAVVGPSLFNPIILGTAIAFLVTLLLVVIVGYFVSQTITRPLTQLATLTKQIAQGETDARANTEGRDEISRVGESMNYMLDSIARLIQETQAQRDALQGQVEKLVSEVSGVGEGDLSLQAEVTADALGVLADSFNYMVEELGSLVIRVKAVANEVDHSTSIILDSMTQLVETGDTQIEQISRAAIEVERMSASTRQVADRAQVLYGVARTARQDAKGGREAVQQAVEGMGRINDNVQTTALKVQTLGDRSREIDEIVAAIGSIAHQTNRLALDAAIQAAMAGENGKGFGAVAADIRRLAERAKDQASSIVKIVRSVREDIGAVAISMRDTERETSQGMKLTQKAGMALESIFTAVEQQAREIENINKGAIQQLQSSNTVVQVMHAVTQSTKQSSVNTREASQNMERLVRLIEQLRASVEAFKLREDQSYFVHKTNTNITLENEPENALAASGASRTVSATAQPVWLSGAGTGGYMGNSLPSLPPSQQVDNPFSFPPMTPLRQNNDWDGFTGFINPKQLDTGTSDNGYNV